MAGSYCLVRVVIDNSRCGTAVDRIHMELMNYMELKDRHNHHTRSTSVVS